MQNEEGDNKDNEELQEMEKIVNDQQQKKGGNVKQKDFEMITVIGKGSYGKVLLVRKKDNG